MAWNVPAVTDSPHAEAGEPGAQLTGGLAGERDREHVRADRSMPSRDCQAMRRVSTRVLPEPAPARIASGAARLGDRVALGRVETLEERRPPRHGTAGV